LAPSKIPSEIEAKADLHFPRAIQRASCGTVGFHPWVVILAALAVSYLVFGALALGYALNPDDRMIAWSAWSHLHSGLQKWGVNP
jgi:hypothetical protein